MQHERLNLVTIATTWYPIRAWLIRNRLAAAGIEAIVADESIVTMDWLTANAIGGIKVQVPLTQAEAACAELESDASVWLPVFVSSNADIEHCPVCQSIDVCDEDYSRRKAFLAWFFLGIPIPFRSKRQRCLECGFRFKDGDLPEVPPRPFQFSLMTLMTWVTIAACLCGILRLAIQSSGGINPIVGETQRH